MTNQKKKTKEESAVREIVKNPGRDDVHEQRQANQQKEGAVTRAPNGGPKKRPAPH
jgi:hypothetical protein